jgi:uroporphyrinogen III methyltransferase/synthase
MQACIDAARQGKRVVRLKGGDPSIFGRGGEEAEILHQAGIACEIVPGVTAALGAAAFSGIPLTHRSHASGVAIVTGHENPAKAETAIDWHALARFPGTLVIYMGMSRLDRLVHHLLRAGKERTTPAAVVQWATRGEQLTVTAPLGELPDAVRAAGLAAPALIIVGSVVALREKLHWFEKLPLFGRRVLVTRPRHQADELAARITALGGIPSVLPTVEIREPADWCPVDAAIARLTAYHWLVFTSANGVRYFFERLRHQGRDLRAVGHLKLAAIGPKTAEALARYHLDADVVPARYQSEDLAAELSTKIEPGQRVLLARADRGRDLLRQVLAERCEVEQVAVYSQLDAPLADADLLDHLRRGEFDDITLTSTNIARVLVEALDETSRDRLRTGEMGLVSISPVTSEEVRRHGLPVAAEAPEATTDGIVQALVERATAQRCSR